ncbi:hypothetical protein MBLNU457_5618t1 [Dothideomycetes sp. NU457]
MPQPRLIDPAVFFDIVKIRRAVDEATEDAVRASTGFSSTQNGQHGRYDPFGGGQGPKMSKERIHKVRQKAVRVLAKAYTLDEVATSVATMQSTSSLEDVALHVLRREKSDQDARYVHFFHEKIPSRTMEKHTSLEPLTDIIQSMPSDIQAAPLRTRGLTRIFKSDHDGAAMDFTLALQIIQEIRSRHTPGADQLVLASKFKEEREAWNKSGRDWRSVPQIKDEDQPSSLEQQLLFNRAGVYLTIACQYAPLALVGLKQYQQKAHAAAHAGNGQEIPLTADDKKGHVFRLDARKKTKLYARRALKDYLAFLAFFDYTPGLPSEIISEVIMRMYDLADGGKTASKPTKDRLLEDGHSSINSSGTSNALTKHQKPDANGHKAFQPNGWPQLPRPNIYTANLLFSEKPPADLPEYSTSSRRKSEPYSSAAREAVTYHPMLTDAIHSLLLCHSLLQTSPTELARHAYNAARLARIADGYPIFQAARSPSRADWIEILRRTNNFLSLSAPWQVLCQPSPLPTYNPSAPSASSTAPSTELSRSNFSPGTEEGQRPDSLRQKQNETAEQKKERIKQQAILDALSDERVVDEATFQRSVKAREKRAFEDEADIAGHVDAVNNAAGQGGHGSAEHSAKDTRAEGFNTKEYPICSERAEAVARWILEAPVSVGGKKKRPAKKKARATGAASVDAVADGVAEMGVGDGEEVD